MLDAVALANALATVPFVSLGGPWHRAIDQEYLTKPPPGFPPGSPPQPLWPGGAKEKGGRFTPKGSFDTLYLCTDPTTAMLEVGAVFRPPKGPLISARRDPLTLTQAEGTLEAVLDLMNKDIQEALGTNEQELTGSWRTTTNPPTHILGAAVHACGRILAIRWTSPFKTRSRSFPLTKFPNAWEWDETIVRIQCMPTNTAPAISVSKNGVDPLMARPRIAPRMTARTTSKGLYLPRSLLSAKRTAASQAR
jgi:RES domain-containing protein